MNPLLNLLSPYPFEKIRILLNGINPPNLSPIKLSIGEPKHDSPKIILDALSNHLSKVSEYPLTKGSEALRTAIKDWLQNRFYLKNISADTEILPVNGTREALFAFAQAVLDDNNPLVMIPNPFYQIYEGAVLLAGASIQFINLSEHDQFQPNFQKISEKQWRQCQLIYICSPNNPTGSVLSKNSMRDLIILSQKYDFIIASDECYSEIYFDETNPPCGLLEVANEIGLADYKNCVVFHSLSKRSNVPGLRSGFVAGDATILQKFLLYRTYHGCAMPMHHQMASVLAWQDETHVLLNRQLYRDKFKAVIASLDIKTTMPDAGFYLWLKTPISDTEFTKNLFATQNVSVVPGRFLSRESDGVNPGNNFVRMALVADINECLEAVRRINNYLTTI